MLIKKASLLFFLSASLLGGTLGLSSLALSAEGSLLAEGPLLAEGSSLTNSSLSNLLGNSTDSVLPADTAFTLSVLLESHDTVVLMWDIKPGYYLYRKSLAITENNTPLNTSPLSPAGTMIQDEFFGKTEVYYDSLIIKFPLTNTLTTPLSQTTHLQLSYQGCAEAGFCYPMQQKSISLEKP